MTNQEVIHLVPSDTIRSRFRPLLIGTIRTIRPDCFEIEWPSALKTYYTYKQMRRFEKAPLPTP